jgi:RNA polymerase sigma-70 factor (sigma-B/F/G subfamily)
MDALRITMRRNRSEDRFVVAGELDLASAPQLRDALVTALQAPRRGMVVDVSDVRFLDCTAVGMLVQVRTQAEERGCTMRVAGATGIVLEVLEIAGVAKSLGVYAEAGPDQPPPSHRWSAGGGDTPAEADKRPSDALVASMLDALTELPVGCREHTRLRTHVVAACAPFATALARRFTDRGEPFDDLNQVAMVGLLKAVDGYNPSKGRESRDACERNRNRFIAYATPTILGELRRHFRDRTWSMTVPRRYKDMRLLVNSAREELIQRRGVPPSTAELAEHLGVPTEEVLDAIEAAQAYRSASLFTPVGDDGVTLVDVIGGPDPDFDQVENRVSLPPLLAKLPEREQRILAMRFYGNMTQSQIADATGVSQMHVSRLLKGALGRLREELMAGEG